MPSGLVVCSSYDRNRLPRAANFPEPDFWPGATSGLLVIRTQYGTGKGRTSSPLHASHGLHLYRCLLHSFHATSDTRAAARHNLVTVGVEDLKRNCIGEFVGVVDLDRPREPVGLRPDSSGAKSEGLGYCAIRVAVRVPPDTQICSA